MAQSSLGAISVNAAPRAFQVRPEPVKARHEGERKTILLGIFLLSL